MFRRCAPVHRRVVQVARGAPRRAEQTRLREAAVSEAAHRLLEQFPTLQSTARHGAEGWTEAVCHATEVDTLPEPPGGDAAADDDNTPLRSVVSLVHLEEAETLPGTHVAVVDWELKIPLDHHHQQQQQQSPPRRPRRRSAAAAAPSGLSRRFRSLHLYERALEQYNCTVQSLVRLPAEALQGCGTGAGPALPDAELLYLRGVMLSACFVSRLHRGGRGPGGGATADAPPTPTPATPPPAEAAGGPVFPGHDVLIVGGGAGHLPMALAGLLGGGGGGGSQPLFSPHRITVVEIEPAVVRAAQRFFGYPAAELRTVVGCGGDYLQQCASEGRVFDVIYCNSYANTGDGVAAQGGLPSAVHRCLAPRGVAVANLIYSDPSEFSDQLLSWRAAFLQGYVHPLPLEQTQALLFACAAPPDGYAAPGQPRRVSNESLRSAAEELEQRTGIPFDTSLL